MKFRNWFAMCCTLLSLGCGAGGGTLSGVVTFKSRPLALGTVTVVNEQGQFGSAEIQPDGAYRIENCPRGKLKIAVASIDPRETAARSAAPGGRAPPPEAIGSAPKGDASKWFPIPETYSQPDVSGLSVEVAGDTVHNIALE